MADTIQHVTIKGVTYDLPSGGSGAVSSVNGKDGAVVLDASDVGALPDSTAIPTKTSDLTNDSGFLTTETDPTVPSWAKQSTKPSYTAQEVGALPSSTVIPSKVSQLQNDSGYITGYTETDPTVPSWAKASSKPTYTAQEVGALPSSTVIPSKVSQLQNDSGFITGYTETDPTVPSWAKASSKPTYTASEVGALPDTTSIPENTSDLNNDSGFITINNVAGSYLPLSAGSSNALTSDLYIQGDVHRTPQTYSASPSSSSVSLTTGNQKLCEVSNISAGVYIITAAIHFTASSNPGIAFVNLYKSSTASNTIMYSQHHVGRSSCYFNDTTWATFGDGASCSFYFEPNVTGTANAVVLSMIRIA